MSTPPQPPRYPRPYVTSLEDMPWMVSRQWLSSDGDKAIVPGACVLLGWAYRNESTASPFGFALYDGAQASGHRVASVGAPANSGSAVAIPYPGVLCENGLHAVVGTGTFHGAVWVMILPGGVS